MSGSGADRIVRDIRQVLALAGLPESREGDPAGGYVVFERDGRAHVGWVTESGFYDQAGSIGLVHPHHPMTRLDRDMIAVMERAVADVLYAAGFTVVLRPGVTNSNPEKGSDPSVIVAAGPVFRAWATG
jgi:hypothetical protein